MFKRNTTSASRRSSRASRRLAAAVVEMLEKRQLLTTIVYVDTNLSSSGDGSSWASAYTSLQDGLSAAEADGPSSANIVDVYVAGGTYLPTTGTDRTYTFEIPNHVAVYGGYEGSTGASPNTRDATTTLSGDIGSEPSDGSYHVVTFDGAGSSTVLDGVTVTDGYGDGSDGATSLEGAGIFDESGSPTINNCVITGDTDDGEGSYGGGVYIVGSPSITDCTITYDSAVGGDEGGGGGISVLSGSPSISNTTISNNIARFAGGGVLGGGGTSGPSVDLTDCQIEDNIAGENYSSGPEYYSLGGGLALYFGNNSEITNCVISGNNAGSEGGGIYFAEDDETDSVDCTITDSRITSNGAGEGGGLYGLIGNVTVDDCTFSGNAAASGGAVFANDSDITALNSIFYSDNAGEFDTEGGGTIAVSYSDVEDAGSVYPGTGNIDQDPQFGTDYELQESGSPCIQAGDTAYLPSGLNTDLAGNPRIVDNNVDMGAYENQYVYVDWTGDSSSNDWDTADNWTADTTDYPNSRNPNYVPTSYDDVTVPADANPALGSDYSDDIDSLSLGAMASVTIANGAALSMGSVVTTDPTSSIVNNGTISIGSPSGDVDADSNIALLLGTGTLTIGNGSTSTTLALTGTAGVDSQNSISINGSGSSASVLDLGENALLISDGGSPSAAESAVQAYIESGAIFSSYVNANSDLGIAYADGSDAGLSTGGAGDNLIYNSTLPAGEVVIQPDLLGDADMSGTVNFHDLQLLLGDFGDAGFWDQGNFNNHATVDFNDLQFVLGYFDNSYTSDGDPFVSFTGGGADENWSDASNWSDDLVPTSGDDVYVPSGVEGLAIPDGSYSVLTLTSESPIVLESGADLDVTGPSDPVLTVDAVATLELSADSAFIGSIVNNGSIVVTGSGLSLSANVSGTGTFTVDSGSSLTDSGTLTQSSLVNNGSLTLDGNSQIGQITGTGTLVVGNGTAGATVVLTGTNVVSTQNALTINSGSSLDLGENALLVSDNYIGTTYIEADNTAEATVQGYIESGAIFSSFVNEINTNAGQYMLGVAYADGNDANLETSDSGLADDSELPAGEIVMEPDILGDADLSGSVAFHDQQILDSTIGSPGFWDEANFLGSSTVNSTDNNLINDNYGLSYEDVITGTDANASLNDSFGTSGQVTTGGSSTPEGLSVTVIPSSGNILVSGIGYDTTGNQDIFLAEYSPNGSLDTSFGSDGIVLTNINGTAAAAAVSVLSSGNILVAGYGTDPTDSDQDIALAEYNPNGTLDTSFGSDGIALTDLGNAAANALTVLSDGSILVAGYGVDGSSQQDFALVKFNDDGSLDSSFGTDGVVLTAFSESSEANALTVLYDGSIVVAGEAGLLVGSVGHQHVRAEDGLADYNSDGSLDTSFGTSGLVRTNIGGTAQWNAVNVSSDGEILTAGFGYSSGVKEVALAEYATDGTLDDSFGNQYDGISLEQAGAASAGNALTVLSDGSILVTGFGTNNISGNQEFMLAEFDSSGNGVGNYQVFDVGSGDSAANAMVVMPDGSILLVGYGTDSSENQEVAMADLVLS
jgi:uncharacterized delta-60 repeat protein